MAASPSKGAELAVSHSPLRSSLDSLQGKDC